MSTPDLSASQWYVKLRGSNADPETRAAFDAWKAADPENELAYIECEIADLAAAQLASEPRTRVLIDAVGDTFSDTSLGVDIAPRRARTRTKFAQLAHNAYATLLRHDRSVLTAGAAVMSLAFIGLMVLVLTQGSGLSPTRYIAQLGEQKSIALNDGSTVRLNTATEIAVNFQPSRRLIQFVRGEAVFDVAHDSSRPFDVRVGSRIVRAVGTRFNVYVDNDEVTVSLLEGKIQIIDVENETRVSDVLSAGASATFSKSSHAKAMVTVGNDFARIEAWLKGQLAFSDWDLLEAIKEHNRYAKIKIYVEDATLTNMRIAGVFDVGDTDSFLSALQATFPISVRKTATEAWLSAKAE